MPVGIKLRVSELCGDALLQTFGDEVFKPFGFLVNILDRKIQKNLALLLLLKSKALQEPTDASFRKAETTSSHLKSQMVACTDCHMPAS
jgi:hypothetical protein